MLFLAIHPIADPSTLPVTVRFMSAISRHSYYYIMLDLITKKGKKCEPTRISLGF